LACFDGTTLRTNYLDCGRRARSFLDDIVTLSALFVHVHGVIRVIIQQDVVGLVCEHYPSTIVTFGFHRFGIATYREICVPDQTRTTRVTQV
jgi:hypothetical protein